MDAWKVESAHLVRLTITLGATIVASYFLLKNVVEFLDPTAAQKKKAKKLAELILPKLGVKNMPELTEYELLIATNLVQTSVTGINWEDVGGYEEEITELQDNVILPLKLHNKSLNFSPPHGVLLYGPPGCGKTLLARAVAKAAGARFINLQVSTLTDKWYGESNKLASAVFSLAKKLQPSIIFIDEIDSFLRTRASHDHEATAMMKALFMSLWDGFNSDPSCRIVIMGATNRPQDVDPAIIRRMPSRFYIKMPNEHQRESILDVILKEDQCDNSVNKQELAKLSNGFSGSDLKEVARLAAVIRVKDMILNAVLIDDDKARPLCQDDLKKAIEKYKKCKQLDAMRLLFEDHPLE